MAHAAPSAHATPQTALTFTTYTTAHGLGANHVESVFAIGSTIFAATRGAGGGLSVSTDAGASFTSRTAADGFTSRDSNEVFGQDNKVYVGTDDGLFISTDGGATFTARTKANGLATNYAIDVLAIGDTVYVASSDYPNGGVGISYNGGTNFMNLSGGGLTSSFVYSVAAVGSDIYAGSFGQGLFRSTNSGPEVVTFPVLLQGMPQPVLTAYPKPTVIAEKLEAIVRLGRINTRVKDHFDL